MAYVYTSSHVIWLGPKKGVQEMGWSPGRGGRGARTFNAKARNTRQMPMADALSNPLKGSSSSSTEGSRRSARAMAVFFCCPPLRTPQRRVAMSSHPHSARTSRTRRSTSALGSGSVARQDVARYVATGMCRGRLGNCGTRPTCGTDRRGRAGGGGGGGCGRAALET